MKKKMASAKNVKTEKRYDPSEWDESKSTEVDPNPCNRGGISTSIRLPLDMIRKLRRVAGRKGDIGYQTLIKIWIAERLEDELKKRVSR